MDGTPGIGADWRPDLIEEMRFDPLDGIVELERHVARVTDSAQQLSIEVDRHALRNDIHAATFRLTDPARVRLRVSSTGAVAIETGPLPETPPEPVRVALVPLPVAGNDPRRRHSSSDRGVFASARAAADTWEVIFVDVEGRCVEGSFATLFVPRDDRLLTPTIASAPFPSILRAYFLDLGEAAEARLVPADLAGGFFVGTMLHGLVAAQLA